MRRTRPAHVQQFTTTPKDQELRGNTDAEQVPWPGSRETEESARKNEPSRRDIAAATIFIVKVTLARGGFGVHTHQPARWFS